MKSLPHHVTRTLLIHATREIVFRFFTDSERWARWWGAGSAIDARPGGAMKIRYSNGVEAVGEVLEIAAPDHIVFTYGYENGKPIPKGGSRVTIRLQSEDRDTRLTLLHEFAETGVRDEFIQGWRFQLSLFANVVSEETNANAAKNVDQWFAAWSIPDDSVREKTLGDIATPNVRLRDRYSSLEGIAEVVPHMGAAQRFMPGFAPQRVGEVRHCQGTVLAEWAVAGKEGQKPIEGTNVFIFDSNGRIESVTGFQS